MTAIVEIAPTGRAKCRGCDQPIAKGERRIGDRFENPFADGTETTHWYHAQCAAYKRPEVLLEALGAAAAEADRALAAAAQQGIEHRRLPRIDGAERAASGRATCRACREKIASGSWRIRLLIFDTGRYEPAGFVHAGCASGYFECADLLARARHFSRELGDTDAAELQQALTAGQ